MGRSTIRKAMGAVKDQTSIGLAMVAAGRHSLADLDVAIVKATRHDDTPAEERHIREILNITCYSRVYVAACVAALSKRLARTTTWTVAVKTLVLVYRLLSEGDDHYEQEMFFATRRRGGTRLLDMSEFRDNSTSSDSWDYSAFVRTFARYIEERLEFRMHGRRSRRTRSMWDVYDEDPHEIPVIVVKVIPVRDMESDKILSRVHQLLRLLERFLACRPTGLAKSNGIVLGALHGLVKESVQVYHEIAEIMGVLIDRFMEMEMATSLQVLEIFSRIAKQFGELRSFYDWSSTLGVGKSTKYPAVEVITPKKLEVMQELIRDKSAVARRRNSMPPGQKQDEAINVVDSEPAGAVNAQPPPTEIASTVVKTEETGGKDEAEEIKACVDHRTEVDLLDLKDDDEPTIEERGSHELALALFDSELAMAAPALDTASESEEQADWESVLVKSASKLSDVKSASIAGELDMLLLNGMYQLQHVPAYASSSVAIPGSLVYGQVASSPAPVAISGYDPFSTSAAISPPAYFAMWEMEKKQQLVAQERSMWQQYHHLSVGHI